MKKLIKILLIVIILILIPIIIFQLVPQASFDHKEADYSLDINTLASAFNEDESAANKLYLGKVIEVSGEILEVFKDEGDSWVALLGAQGAKDPLVMSTFDNNVSDEHQIEVGQTITVKGQCTGKLMEVVLNKASIVLLK